MTTAQAVQFNERLALANRELNDSATGWARPMAEALKGGRGDPAAMKAGVAQAGQAFARVKARMLSVSVPDDDSARAYFAAHQRFLAVEDGIVNRQLPTLAELMADARLTGPARTFALSRAFTAMVFEEQQALHAFAGAQAAFAGANGIRMDVDPRQAAASVMQSCVLANQRIGTAEQGLTELVRPALDGKPVAAPAAEAALADYRQTLVEVRAMLAGVDASGTVPDLRAAERALLEVDAGPLAEAFADVVRLAREPAPAERRAQVRAALAAAMERERAALEKVRNAAQVVSLEFPGL